jgi:hypothetical protein
MLQNEDERIIQSTWEINNTSVKVMKWKTVGICLLYVGSVIYFLQTILIKVAAKGRNEEGKER